MQRNLVIMLRAFFPDMPSVVIPTAVRLTVVAPFRNFFVRLKNYFLNVSRVGVAGGGAEEVDAAHHVDAARGATLGQRRRRQERRPSDAGASRRDVESVAQRRRRL